MRKIIRSVGRYLVNLLRALAGVDPWRMGLEDAYDKLAKAAANMERLQDQYCTALDKWEQQEKMLSSTNKLVENLRARLREKDELMEKQGADFRARMEKMKADYQLRIDGYNQKIEELELKLAAKAGRARNKKKGGE